MNSPTEFLRVAVPAAISAGKEIMRIYKKATDEWQVSEKQDHSPLTAADLKSNEVIMSYLLPTGIPVISEETACESYEDRKNYEQVWIVDPLDGTQEFIKRNGEFTVNIALVKSGEPVAGVIYIPTTQTLYFGVRGFGAFRLGDITVAKDEVSMVRAAVRLPLLDYQPPVFTVVASRSHLSVETEEYIDALRSVYPDLTLISAGSSLKICKVVDGSANIYPRLAPTMEWDTAAGDAIARAAGCEVYDAETHAPLVYNKEDLHNPNFVVKGRDM